MVTAELAKGLPFKSVAFQLGISIHTAKRHGEHVYRKLGVHSRAELAVLVHRELSR